MNQVRYVDGAATPGGNGSECAPFSTLQAAVDGLPTGGIILIAPNTYPAALNIPGGFNYTFAAIGFSGLLQVLVTGLITWHVVDNSQVSWSGVRLVNGATGGPVFTETNAGTGNARWNLFSCIQGVQTHDATARTHNIRIRAASLPVNGLDLLEPAQIPTQLMGFDVSGQVQVASGTLNGPGPFNCALLRTRSGCSIASGITLNITGAGSSFNETSFVTNGPITLNITTAGVLSLDQESFVSWAGSGSVRPANTSFILADIFRLQKDNSTSGAAKTIDFSIFVNHVVVIDVNTTLTFIPPPASQPSDCTLRLLGTTGKAITFSPVLLASGGALAPFVGNCWLRLFWTGTEWWAENIPNLL